MRPVDRFHPFVRRAACAVMTAACLLLTVQADARTPAAQTYVTPSWQQQTDRLGFQWEIQPGGYLQNGTNHVFVNAMAIEINGNGFGGGGQQQMTPDGLTYLLSGPCGPIELSRLITIDPNLGVCRWVDSFTNTGSSDLTLNVNYGTYLRYQAQSVQTDTGAAFQNTLGKDEGGLVFVQSQQNIPSIAFLLTSPKSKVKPTFQMHSANQALQVTYALTIPKGKTVSLMSAIAQRHFNTTLSDKEMKKLFDPMRSRSFIKDLPRELRSTLVNFRGGGMADGQAPRLWTLPDDLDLDPQSQDLLAISQSTRLNGSADWSHLAVENRYGKRELESEQVAAVAGPRFRGDLTQVYLRDGQIITGKLSADALHFVLASGPQVPLSLESLDRLVMKQSNRNGQAPSEAAAAMETFEGDRLLLKDSDGLSLSTVGPYGSRRVDLNTLRWVRHLGREQAAYQFALHDGSVWVGLLDAGEIEVDTMLFGPQTLDAALIRSLSTTLSDDLQGDDGMDQAHLRLEDDQVLVGSFELETLNLMTLSGSIPIPVAHIRELERDDEAEDLPAGAGVGFRASLWGGGMIVGRFTENEIAFRFGAQVWQLPSERIAMFINPQPMIPDSVHSRVVGLIRDLGDNDWQTREDAQKQLISLDAMAVPGVREAMSNQDPEIRRRAEAILAQID